MLTQSFPSDLRSLSPVFAPCGAANREEALVKYILAAETGLGLAQSNAAHLCQVHTHTQTHTPALPVSPPLPPLVLQPPPF